MNLQIKSQQRKMKDLAYLMKKIDKIQDSIAK
jgi:hypothetical protein